MNTVRLTAEPDAAGTYAFQLAGHLDDHWSTRFEGVTCIATTTAPRH